MAAGVNTLLLDADGVVQTTGNGWRAAFTALLPAGRRQPDQVDAFMADVFAAERPCLSGEGDFAEALGRVLLRWESPSTVNEALAAWTLIDVNAGVIETVRNLRQRGLGVHLATNQQAQRAAYMSETLGYRTHFDREFYSCRMGVTKPDAAYFQRILQELQCVPSNVLFIDDHERNVRAASEQGMQGMVYHLDAGLGVLHRGLAEFGIGID